MAVTPGVGDIPPAVPIAAPITGAAPIAGAASIIVPAPPVAPVTSTGLFGIAAVQMHVSAFTDNVDRMGVYMRHIRVRFPWVRMVLFSEDAPLGPHHEAEPLPGPTEHRLCALARETGLWLITGSMFERVTEPSGEDVVYNTCSVINPAGEVIRRYRKMFPFRPYERDVKAGNEFCVFDIEGAGRFGVSICYDKWFPETTRTLVAMGAEVILHPNYTDTSTVTWSCRSHGRRP